jgi:hypothetical protein
MLQEAAAPDGGLYRVALWPDPLAWPAWEYMGEGRFDDPERTFRTLYAGEQRRACFTELLARFRPSPQVLAALREIAGATDSLLTGEVPVEWYRARCVGQFRLLPNQRWLDLRALETREALRIALADTLVKLELQDLDVSGVRSSNRKLTQAIARWAYEQGFNGIVYSSRLDDTCGCWAIFEGAQFEPIELPKPIGMDDPDMRLVAQTFGLRLPG